MVLLANNGNYSVRYYSNSTQMREVFLKIPSTSKYFRVVKYGPNACLLFDKELVIIAMNSSLT